MRRLVACQLLSLGVREESLEVMTGWDEARTDDLARVIATQASVLLGRRTYRSGPRSGPAAR